MAGIFQIMVKFFNLFIKFFIIVKVYRSLKHHFIDHDHVLLYFFTFHSFSLQQKWEFSYVCFCIFHISFLLQFITFLKLFSFFLFFIIISFIKQELVYRTQYILIKHFFSCVNFLKVFFALFSCKNFNESIFYLLYI